MPMPTNMNAVYEFLTGLGVATLAVCFLLCSHWRSKQISKKADDVMARADKALADTERYLKETKKPRQ